MIRIRVFASVMLAAVIAIGLASRPVATEAQQDGRKLLVLQGGLLIDGNGGTPVTDPVVIVEGSKIQRVGTKDSLPIPADAEVINTSGKTIIPGLVDSHVHYRNSLAPLFLYWGVTTLGDMGNPRGWILAMKRAYAEGRPLGPSIMAVGNILTVAPNPGDPESDSERSGFPQRMTQVFLRGNGHHLYVRDEASLEARISESAKLGVDGVKLYSRLTPEMIKLGAQVAHRHGLPVVSHYTWGTPRRGIFLGTDEILDTGIDVHAHLFGLVKATVPEEIRQRIDKGEDLHTEHLMDTSKFPALIEKMVAKKMFLNPTLGAEWAKFSKHRAEFDELNTRFLAGPVAANLPDVSRPRYAPAYKPYRGEHAELEQEGYKKELQFVKEFVAAGGKVIAGTDAGAGAQPPGLTMHVEMEILVEARLSPMQAIQAATSWPMEAWRKSKEGGTIEAGKRADLVILKRNPLDDISATRDIDQIIKSGIVIDRESLANWKEPVTRPSPEQTGPANPMIQLPYITEISPDSFQKNQGNIPEMTIHGVRFTSQSFVIFNDRSLPAKFYDETRLGIRIKADQLKQPGTFPLVVVRPGSGGGPSNPYYVVVTGN